MSNAGYHRYRFTFSKTGAIRFISHLDLHRTWERALRRAGIPLAYTKGYNPRPRINLGRALPLGHSSDYELADLWLEAEIPAEVLQGELLPTLPAGLNLTTTEKVDVSEPSLQSQISAAEYQIHVETTLPLEDLESRVEALLTAKHIHRQRRGKEYDLRPLIEGLEITCWDEPEITFRMRLAAREGATGRPEEVLLALDVDPSHAIFHSKHLIMHDE